MNNADQLRDELSKVFTQLKAKKIKPSEAAQFSNLAGKIISSAKTQVEYYVARKEAPNIPFLETKRKPNARLP
jgi:hypothetical protein